MPLYLGRLFPGFLLPGSPRPPNPKAAPKHTAIFQVSYYCILSVQPVFLFFLFQPVFLSLPPLPPEYGHHEGRDHANNLHSISLTESPLSS